MTTPNQAASGNGAVPLVFHTGRVSVRRARAASLADESTYEQVELIADFSPSCLTWAGWRSAGFMTSTSRMTATTGFRLARQREWFRRGTDHAA